MAGLYSSLNRTVNALAAQSRGLEVAGKNVANVSNANYARQRVVFGDRGSVKTQYGAESMGLEVIAVQQLRNSILDAQVAREQGLKSQYTTVQQGLQKAQAALGESVNSTASTSTSSGTHSIADCMSDLFNSFSSLSAKTTDVGVRQTLIQNAQILADRFNLTDSRLSQVQDDMTTQIKTDIESVNTLLSAIGSLNRDIGRTEINNEGGAVDLRDSRQAKIEELSKLINFETKDDPVNKGQVQIVMKDGGGSDVLLVAGALSANLTTDTGATTFTANNIPGAATGVTATVSITSGTIRGALDVRDGSVTDLRDELDMLARQLVTSVNSTYGSGTSGLDFFDVSAAGSASAVTAATIKFNTAVTATNLEPDLSSATNTGDNTIPAGIANLANKVFSTTGSPADYVDGTLNQHYVRSVSSLGQSLTSTASRLSDQTSIEALVRSQRDSVSGVSLDEEMADLMKYQRAFQANSKVFNVVDQLLETIVTGLGNN